MILEGKTILVTGGTGSMGKTFVKRALSGKEGTPKKIIVLSRDEAKQHYMRVEYLNKTVTTDEVIYKNFKEKLEFRIGDVRNYRDVCSALHDVDIVINAAALKQVPSCEYFPSQAVQTNCDGVSNIISAIREFNFPVETVVGVSTDKACKPVNVMGMTKAIQERLFIAANVLNPKTRFICVRYGNVLASRGSVIPLFHEQIRSGGPVTVTDKKMTRFLLSLEKAVDTVIASISYAYPGETFIPIVPTANMYTLAQALIGELNIPIKITGIRPGEKLHESLISLEESFRTYRTDYGYYAIKPMLPEIPLNENSGSQDLIGEYSSEHQTITLEETIKLLIQHDLDYKISQESYQQDKKELIR
jgi:UDP-glucose 4-epimerase